MTVSSSQFTINRDDHNDNLYKNIFTFDDRIRDRKFKGVLELGFLADESESDIFELVDIELANTLNTFYPAKDLIYLKIAVNIESCIQTNNKIHYFLKRSDGEIYEIIFYGRNHHPCSLDTNKVLTLTFEILSKP